MYKRTEDGKPIDPPVIPEFETQLNRAMAAADEREIARINEQYEKTRYQLADDQDAYEKKEAEDQAASDAEARQVVRDRENA